MTAWRRRAAGCVLGLALVLTATGARAQSTAGTDPSDVPAGTGQTSQQHQRKHPHAQGQPQAAPADLKVAPAPWPRLDPGAVVCRTEADLHQHLAAIEARLDGNASAVAEPAGCSVIMQPTAVAVLSRDGPARTKVRLSDAPGETGWTDAFLPEKSSSR